MFENCLYQPTELLAVKLSERSPDLYIFWVEGHSNTAKLQPIVYAL